LPPCGYLCGGCSLQHLDPKAQIRWKQEMLARILADTGGVRPERWLPPLAAWPWGYRRKARLGVRYVAKKGLARWWGFGSAGLLMSPSCGAAISYIPQWGERIEAITELLDGLSIRHRSSSWRWVRAPVCWCCGSWNRPRHGMWLG